jgi:uncharacterized protein (TIGR03067 family)
MSARAALPCVAVLLVVAATPARDARKELEKLQGEWVGVSVEEKGKKIPGESAKKLKLTIKGEKWLVRFGDKQVGDATFKIDPSKDPKRIDMTFKVEGDDLDSYGIYKLDGDTLTLRRAGDKAERPKEFKGKNDRYNFEVWKRVKK